MNPRPRIPTNIITGFLGSGKTTAILHLLHGNASDEKWGVLVNEFGEIGIDGAILSGRGAEVREIAGGCMCCAGALPMEVSLNALIRTKPDRLIIEPTGLGHPQAIVDLLLSEQYRTVVDLRAVICLLDPRKLKEPRYLDNIIFRDQLAIADVLVANKADLCDAADEQAFKSLCAAMQPQKLATGWVEQGRLQREWLDLRSDRTQPDAGLKARSLLLQPPPLPEPIMLKAGEPFARRENRGDGYFSCGWLFADDTYFDFNKMMSLLMPLQATRVKGLLRTERGNFIINAENGVLSVSDVAGNVDSIIEIINSEALAWLDIENQLLAARI